MKSFSLFLFLPFLLMSLCGLSARAEFKVPSLSGPVMDYVGYLQSSDARELANLLYDYNAKGKAQIQVLIIPDLQGEEIETASIKITDAWKLGDKKRDNGVLFLVAAKEHKMRIEVGQGLEGALPDITAKRIIADQVTPLFKANQMSDGIVAGVTGIIRAVDKEYADQNLAEATPAPEGKKHSVPIILILFFILIVLSRLFRGGGFGGGGFYGGGFGGGFGGGGGSSWSGGGGGFSGGGASGNW